MMRWVFTNEDGVVVTQAVMDEILRALREHGEPYKDVYLSVPVRARGRIDEWYMEIEAEGIWDVRVSVFRVDGGEELIVVEGLRFHPKEVVGFV